MFPEFAAFNVEIKDKEFIADGGLNFPRTAIITFISAEGHEESVSELGYPGEQKIYEMISRGDPLILDNINKDIHPGSKRRDLLPIYSFNGTGLWLAKQRGKGKLAGSSSRLKRWQDLMQRMSGDNLGQ